MNMMKQIPFEQTDRDFTKYIYDPQIKADFDAYFYAEDEVAEQDALDDYRSRYNAMTAEQKADYDHRMYVNLKHLIECTRKDMDDVLTRLENKKRAKQKLEKNVVTAVA